MLAVWRAVADAVMPSPAPRDAPGSEWRNLENAVPAASEKPQNHKGMESNLFGPAK